MNRWSDLVCALAALLAGIAAMLGWVIVVFAVGMEWPTWIIFGGLVAVGFGTTFGILRPIRRRRR